MSASPAKVSSGLARQTIPAITSSTPNETHTHRSGIGALASARFWKPANRNMKPTMSPTVLTEVSSNWRIATETMIQQIPATSESHQ